MEKIILAKEKETLLIPLYGKAIQMKRESPILVDKKAFEIINKVEYDFSSLKIPQKTNDMMCIRAKMIDDLVRKIITIDCAVLHLGCGLDSRYLRIDNRAVDWYDIDFPEVIEIRRLFYEENTRYHFIPSSVTDNSFIKKIPAGRNQYIVIAEGLFMYLYEDEIKSLLIDLKDRIGEYTLVFDAFSKFTAKKVGSHPSIKKTGAVVKWGIDNPGELTNWDEGIEFISEDYFTSSKEIAKLNSFIRFLYKIASCFGFVKKAHRLLTYKVRK